MHKQAVPTELPDAAGYRLSPDERTVVREALTRAEQGEFATVADLDAIVRRPWG